MSTPAFVGRRSKGGVECTGERHYITFFGRLSRGGVSK